MPHLRPTARRFPWLPIVLAAVAWHAAALQAAERSASFRAALESITASDLKAHVDYLADDALEGRESGARGGRAAGKYLAEKLAGLHLKPGGVDGAYFQPFGPGYRNVLALLPGSDAKLGREVVVVSAHYDHVGYGNSRNSRGPIGFIHNGADDNASGTSGLLELAQAFTLLAHPPKRTVLIAFWDAEERGMLGSKHWLGQPTFPRKDVAVMLCMDMIGRLRDDRLSVFGSRSSFGLRRLVSSQNDGLGLLLDFHWSIKANSDHYAFFEQGYPVLLLHTGLHDDYHRPSDDADKINSAGMGRAVRLMFGVACELADAPQEIAFRRASAYESDDTLRAVQQQQPELPSRLGVSWRADEPDDPGVRLTAIAGASPAAKAGLRAGDRILRLADRPIRTGDDLSAAVMAAANPAAAVVERPGEKKPLELTIRLAGEPMRLGITWRTDAVEPGALILTHVVPGSPAARAGLQPEDRIYQVAGHDFADDEAFVKLTGSHAGPIELLVERNGQLRTAVLRFEAQPVKRAA